MFCSFVQAAGAEQFGCQSAGVVAITCLVFWCVRWAVGHHVYSHEQFSFYCWACCHMPVVHDQVACACSSVGSKVLCTSATVMNKSTMPWIADEDKCLYCPVMRGRVGLCLQRGSRWMCRAQTRACPNTVTPWYPTSTEPGMIWEWRGGCNFCERGVGAAGGNR